MSEPRQYEQRSLASLADYINGFAFKPSHLGEAGIPVVRIEQLNNPEGRFDKATVVPPIRNHIDSGDILFSWSGTLKASRWKHGKAYLNQHLFKVIPKSGVNDEFLLQLLNYSIPELSMAAHGSTMKHIQRGELEKFLVCFPCDKGEQRRIADLLSAVDELIESIEAIASKKQRLFTGLRTSLLKNGQHTPISAALRSEWKERPLGEVATLQRGFDLPTGDRVPGNVPVISSSGYEGTHNAPACRGPGVVTGRSGTIGRVLYVEDDYWPLNTTLYVRDFHGNNPRFVAHLLRELRLEKYAAATSVPSLNRNFVHPILVRIPPPEEQARLAELLDHYQNEMNCTLREREKLVDLKNGLLAAVMSKDS